MKLMGRFTGDFYPEYSDPTQYPECICEIPDDKEGDTSYIANLHAKGLIGCAVCKACPAARKIFDVDDNQGGKHK